MSNFLFEIGTEELPADFARSVLPQLEEMVRCDLDDSRLDHSEIICSSTPRRICVLVNSLADTARQKEEIRKGPPASHAFQNGEPTQAAVGFAKRFDLDVDLLEVRETPKGPFVFARILEKGQSSSELLIKLVPHWINRLQGKRFMRWGSADRKFSRPLRWLVCLLDDQVLPVKLLDCDPQLIATNQSHGHRLHKKRVTIHSVDKYLSILFQAGVVVSREKRSLLIKDLISEASKKLKANPDFTNSLFEELVDIVESPSLIIGQFDKSFLNLPAELLSTVMQSHQRYIPLSMIDAFKDPLALNAKGILLSNFLCISNGHIEASKNIIKGNERVLRARLSDAQFFINADLTTSSIERREKLSQVTFAEGLGSLLDRVKRIDWIATSIFKELNFTDVSLQNLKRSANFCKHDLVSQIVSEFPELQGIMGAKYLLSEGEPREVALTVLEHYLPRGAGDSLPSTIPGSLLALAERLELILSIFSKGERPSGSSDPYALRRSANGVLQIIWSRSWPLNLDSLLNQYVRQWSELFPNFQIDQTILLQDLFDFFRQRIISLLEENHIPTDIVQAVAGNSIPVQRLLENPKEVLIRSELLHEMRAKGTLNDIHTVVTRASRLADKGSLKLSVLSTSKDVDSKLFEKESEHQMFNLIRKLEPIINSYSETRFAELAQELAMGSGALAAFFDGEQSVMVMVDDLKIRNNRLNMLGILRNQAYILADFNKITC